MKGELLPLFLTTLLITVLLILLIKTLKKMPRFRFIPSQSCLTNVVSFDIVGDTNPCIILESRIGGHECLFMVDTGYAGSPILSLPMLTCESKLSSQGTIEQRTAAAIASVNTYRISETEQEQTLVKFMEEQGAVEYTSGCTMRLMGIGSTAENTSEMLLCPPLEFKTKTGEYTSCKACAMLPHADVLGTNRMKNLHILTIDFLKHVSPCLFDFKAKELTVSIGTADYMKIVHNYTSISSELSGGSFVAKITIGGRDFKCTVDSGASAFVSLSSSAASKIKKCKHASTKIRQIGVNGEDVCSDIVQCNVTFCHQSFEDVPIFLNNFDLDDVDGYIGLSLLRSFDLLITKDELLCKYNELDLITSHISLIASDGSCGSPPSCE